MKKETVIDVAGNVLVSMVLVVFGTMCLSGAIYCGSNIGTILSEK